MRALLVLIVCLALPVLARAEPQQMQTLTFQKVIDGATIVASGKTVRLWGVKAPDPADPDAFAAKLYLKTMLAKGALRCAEVRSDGGRHVMRCMIDGSDVGSLMVQMGMAGATDPYYRFEQATAQANYRGVWRRKSDTRL